VKIWTPNNPFNAGAVQGALSRRTERAVITLRASGELGAETITCKVDTAGALVEAGSASPPPAATASRSARATCCWRRWSPDAGVTLKAVSTALSIRSARAG